MKPIRLSEDLKVLPREPVLTFVQEDRRLEMTLTSARCLHLLLSQGLSDLVIKTALVNGESRSVIMASHQGQQVVVAYLPESQDRVHEPKALTSTQN